jgi:hypothetical protein
MGRKPASRSAVVPRKLVPGPGRIAGPARAADLRKAAHAPRGHDVQPFDRGPLAGPMGLKTTKIAENDPDVIDDFPELAAVRDGELDVIEAYLGACLDEVLGSIG